MTTLAVIALFYFMVSRLAYTVGVGVMLTRQRRDQVFTEAHGVEEGFARFRRYAAILMTNDGLAFVLAAAASWGTLAPQWPSPALIAGGVTLCVVGVGVKLWAATLLGTDGYHWRNFFGPYLEHNLRREGPYRWMKNPMYTVGYLQTYGVALVLGSWPGLLAAAYAHVAILVFYFEVERPHFELVQTSTGSFRRARATEARRVGRG